VPDPAWQNLSAAEFRKSIDLGASGILYDEVLHHGGAYYCFSQRDGQLVAQSLYAGESTYDLEQRYDSLSYFRI
jgi:hypothetical protein